MPILPSIATIDYEVQDPMDSSKIASMQCFTGGSVTLQRGTSLSDLFSASGPVLTATPSHGVPNQTVLHMRNHGAFPELKNSRTSRDRAVHTVTFNGLKPTQSRSSVSPSGMVRFDRQGDLFKRSWYLGTFTADVASATFTKKNEERDIASFNDPAWSGLEVDVSATTSVNIADVSTYMNENPDKIAKYWPKIVIADKGEELQKMVNDLVE